jgi:hypothetical protein
MGLSWSDVADLINGGTDPSTIDTSSLSIDGSGNGITGLETGNTGNSSLIDYLNTGQGLSDGTVDPTATSGSALGGLSSLLSGTSGKAISSLLGGALGAYGANTQNGMTQAAINNQSNIFGQQRASSMKYDAPKTYTQQKTAVADPSAYSSPNFSGQLQSDFDTATSGNQAGLGNGQSQAWGGGKITNTGGGALSYVNPEGNTTNINSGMSPEALARSNPNIASQWNSQYGTSGKPKGAATFFMNNQLPQYASGGSVDSGFLSFLTHLFTSDKTPAQEYADQQARLAAGKPSGAAEAIRLYADPRLRLEQQEREQEEGYTPPAPVEPVKPLARGGLTQYVQGGDPGQSDKVNARMSPGEYVMDADTVSNLGDGNNVAGAAALDKMREAIRTQKRSAPATSIPPKAKAPLAYLKGAK